MKVTAILKGRIDSTGQQPIQIRINDGTKRSFVPTKIRVLPEQFENGKVVKHPKASEYNKEITRLIIIYQAKTVQGEKKEKRVDFYQYFDQCMKMWEKEKKAGTRRHLNSQRTVLKNFAPTLYLQDINVDFLNRYKAKRFEEVDSPNTVWSSIKFLRTMINQALGDRVLKEDPFKGFVRPKYKAARKVYLTESELQKIESVLEESTYSFYGHWFLIACYTGLRVSDLLQFDKKKHIVSGRIVLYTTKTEEIVSLKLTDKLKNYFETIDYKPLGCAAETYREKIKLIAAEAGIKKKISTHTARHSFGVLCATKGIRQEMCAKLMGHSDLKSTAVYYKLDNNTVDREYDKLF